MGRTYTTVITKKGDFYVASVHELPGVKALARTPGEARRLLEAAVAQTSESHWEFATRLKARSSKKERE
jgi:predicted RNase H-like HicB family nuclease